MRRLMLTLALTAAVALGLVWALGGFDGLGRWATEAQRGFQNAMAGALRSLRAGDAGALAALMGVAFAYGFVHAAGPGHGKVLIGGYGAASRVRLVPLSLIALAGSLGQATTAVALVVGGAALLGLTRERLTEIGDAVLAPAAAAAILVIGLWLALRGLRRLRAVALAPGHEHGHEHGDEHGDEHGHEHGHACGHRHGPEPEDIAGLRGWRDAALLVGAIAIRPCTGALFLLIITWHMGLLAAGIAGAYVMALGTASVTLAVAVLSVLARDGALMWSGRLGRLRAAIPVIEIGAGLVVAAVAVQMLLHPT